jgi:hypothetical protein
MRMRSEIVFEALRNTNRFALCHVVSKAVGKLHKPSTRVQDTANDALRLLAGAGRQLPMNPGDASESAKLEANRERETIAS